MDGNQLTERAATTERCMERTYCSMCQQAGSNSEKVQECACEGGLHWECLQKKVFRAVNSQKTPQMNEGFNQVYLPCKFCQQKMLFLVFCDKRVLKIGSLSEAFTNNKRAVLCTVFYVMAICTAYALGTYFMRESFGSLDGLLPFWSILGILVVVIVLQQIMMALLTERKLGVKAIKVFRQKNMDVDQKELKV